MSATMARSSFRLNNQFTPATRGDNTLAPSTRIQIGFMTAEDILNGSRTKIDHKTRAAAGATQRTSDQ